MDRRVKPGDDTGAWLAPQGDGERGGLVPIISFRVPVRPPGCYSLFKRFVRSIRTHAKAETRRLVAV